MVERRTVDVQGVADRCLCRQDRKPVAGPHHRAFDEQAVDPAGILQRVGQTPARLEIKGQRARPELDVEVQQRRGSSGALGEHPGKRCSDG